ncbi:MAG: low molecular weight phosphatase family protein, partial [Nevskiales bacterium]
MFHNILVLCTANICRSPLAEGILKECLQSRPDIVVHSAGVAALTGARAHPIVLDLLRKAQINNMRTHR